MTREDKKKFDKIFGISGKGNVIGARVTGSSRFKAKPITDLNKAMEQVRKIMKKNQKTLEILKH